MQFFGLLFFFLKLFHIYQLLISTCEFKDSWIKIANTNEDSTFWQKVSHTFYWVLSQSVSSAWLSPKNHAKHGEKSIQSQGEFDEKCPWHRGTNYQQRRRNAVFSLQQDTMCEESPTLPHCSQTNSNATPLPYVEWSTVYLYTSFYDQLDMGRQQWQSSIFKVLNILRSLARQRQLLASDTTQTQMKDKFGTPNHNVSFNGQGN